MENILSIKDLVVSFASDGRKDRAVAVNGLSLDIPRGGTVGLVGESGCGKSVTSLSVMGLLAENGRVDAGEACFAGQDLLKLPDRELRKLRGNRISMIFQEPMTSLWTRRRRRRGPSSYWSTWASPRRRPASAAIPTSSPAACASG